jgi:hypothetical protein
MQHSAPRLPARKATPSRPTGVRKPVCSLQVAWRDVVAASDGIADMYDEGRDVLIVRGALDAAIPGEAGERLDADCRESGWFHPNETMPVEDVRLLGADSPATPTHGSPRGVSLDGRVPGVGQGT